MSEQTAISPASRAGSTRRSPTPTRPRRFYGEPVRVGARGRHAARVARQVLRRPASAAATSPPSAPSPRARREAAVWNTYVWVEDADETAAKVRAAGGTVLMEPFDVGDAGRMAIFADPEGAAFCVWQAKEHRGAAVVNEHGSLNFNDLNTRDLEGAQAFYGAVFGWEMLDSAAAPCGRCPATATSSSSATPACARAWPAMGAPERFEDVVASVSPIPDDQPDDPPHWGVTFAVDDADAVAARAAELGGASSSPPFDAPWVRMTIISDPQGATFTASKFVPENKDLGESRGR